MRSPILLVGLMALGIHFALPAHGHAAVKFVVTSTADAPDAKPGDGVCAAGDGGCTLRAAIDEANAEQGQVVIELQHGRYEVDSPLRVSTPVVLAGVQPKDTIIAASAAFTGERLLTFDDAGYKEWREVKNLTLDGNGRTGVIATLRGVPLRVVRSVVQHGLARQEGGAGIYAEGPLVLSESSLVFNHIGEGGGRGAGMLVEEAAGWITQSTVAGNVGRNAGGVFARGSKMVIDHSTLVANAGSPVGGYQQNPKSQLQIRGSWLGETRGLGDTRRLDCRSSSAAPTGIQSGGDNLVAVTGPTSEKLVDGRWQDAFDFYCALTGTNDRSGSLSAPLEGPWRWVTGPTGLVGIEAAWRHPVSRMVRPDRCPTADAWGRSIPHGQNCDAGALFAAPWTEAAASQPAQPKPQHEAGPAPTEPPPPPVWLWIVGFGLAAVVAVFLLTRGARRPPQK